MKFYMTVMGIIISVLVLSCSNALISSANGPLMVNKIAQLQLQHTATKDTGANWVVVKKNVALGEYFPYIDSLVMRYDSLVDYALTEHLLVRANAWIIDTLANTDYYRMIERDSFVYDQRAMMVLRKGDSLLIPNHLAAAKILNDFKTTFLDINIPAYTMTIYQDTLKLFEFPVRVGRNEKKYLTMGNRITDLRTKHGLGSIVGHERDPDFYNPVDGKQFYLTKRDDGKTTLMPQIPWMETEINGARNGQMIHPTTNPETLRKPYSNGCIGTTEADAWIIYYHAPIGTRLNIRYDLYVIGKKGFEVRLKDIYRYYN